MDKTTKYAESSSNGVGEWDHPRKMNPEMNDWMTVNSRDDVKTTNNQGTEEKSAVQ